MPCRRTMTALLPPALPTLFRRTHRPSPPAGMRGPGMHPPGIPTDAVISYADVGKSFSRIFTDRLGDI